MLKKVVIDIETVGEEFEGLDELSKEYILRYAETEEEIESAKQALGLHPLTGEIVAIGMLDPDTDKGVVYFQSPEILQEPLVEEGFELIPDTEAGILRRFWDRVREYDQIITFNGRGFDAPFIILRSAILKIKPTKDLMPNRYSGTSHIDLLDQLTFYGSLKRRFNLHMWCRAFGIRSPKGEGVSGKEVARLFKERKYLDIARYCIGDLYATKKLFQYWDQYVRVGSGG